MNTMRVEDADQSFFTALRAADGAALGALLTDDFVLIDVMRGGEVPRADLIGAVAAGQLRFDAIDLVASRVRRYGNTAIVTGETRMRGRFGDAGWSAHSRYAHVYMELDGRWRLASAQGTQIATD
jgi:ketosteroid isomerase-like protein